MRKIGPKTSLSSSVGLNKSRPQPRGALDLEATGIFVALLHVGRTNYCISETEAAKMLTGLLRYVYELISYLLVKKGWGMV